ncbi:MAG: squalene/phytoene synthase family protein [bacterium]|nr:squalene/phytoene synthase family protein [bacterium]
MIKNTVQLAKKITFNGSKQTYYTAKIMSDKDKVDDFFRAYAYFRWLDDIIDESSWSREQKTAFIKRQKKLIDDLYQKKNINNLTEEEMILAELVNNDVQPDSGLQSFIRNMFAVIEFDTYRAGKLITEHELSVYTDYLAKSVINGLLYFIGNGYRYNDIDSRYKSAKAAHITHLLRDMVKDIKDGFINIPAEYIKDNNTGYNDMENEAFRLWVKERVDLARKYFIEGKHYLEELPVLRCKIVGYWYCARFERILNIIEKDNYILRPEYNKTGQFSNLLNIAWITVSVSFNHFCKNIL